MDAGQETKFEQEICLSLAAGLSGCLWTVGGSGRLVLLPQLDEGGRLAREVCLSVCHYGGRVW